MKIASVITTTISALALAITSVPARAQCSTCIPPLPPPGDFNFGCPVLWNSNGTAPINMQNVPYGRQYTSNYTVRSVQGPATARTAFTTMRPAGDAFFRIVVEQSNWCCRWSNGPCTTCGADFSCVSSKSGWPSSYSFVMPTSNPGDYEIYVSEAFPNLVGVYGVTPIIITKPNAFDASAGTMTIVTSTTGAGEHVNATIRIRNSGELSGVCTPVVYMSTDSTVDTSDTRLECAGLSLGGGGPVATFSIASLGNLSTTLAGTRFFRVRLESFSDTNSTNDWSTNVVPVDFKPDVKFETPHLTWEHPLTTPGGTPQVFQGEDIRLHVRCSNVGNAFARSAIYEIYANSTPSVTGATLVATGPLSFVGVGDLPSHSGATDSFDILATTSPNLGLEVGANGHFFCKVVNVQGETVVSNNTSGFTPVAVGGALDLVLRRPRALDPAETALPDNSANMTWVNLDNDDNDSRWDHNPTNPAQSDTSVNMGLGLGDDDLFRIDIKVKPNNAASHAGNKVTLTTPQGSSKVKYWVNATKGNPFPTTGPIDLLIVAGTWVSDGEWLRTSIYVEGIEAHNGADPLTQIRAEYVGGTATGSPDTEQVQIIGLKPIRIDGLGNGFDPGSNPQHTSNTLDSVLLHTASGDVSSLRVISGARSDDYVTFEDRVRVIVELSAAPMFGTDVYLRPFDIDDPIMPNSAGVQADWAQHLDPNDFLPLNDVTQHTYNGALDASNNPLAVYTLEEDNRNTLRGTGIDLDQRGELVALSGGNVPDADGILKVTLTTSSFAKVVHLVVSHQPGDNYKVVGSPNPAQLARLQNLDQRDGLMVVDPTLANNASATVRAEAEIRLPGTYASPLLTVWRILHMELDSMEHPDAFGDRNRIHGEFTGVAGTGQTANGFLNATNVVPTPNDPAHPLADGSPDRDSSPTADGRFQNGRLTIAGHDVDVDYCSGTAVALTTPGSVVPIPFTVTYMQGGSPVTAGGNVRGFSVPAGGVPGMLYGLDFVPPSAAPTPWNQLMNGTIRIGPAAENPTPSTIVQTFGSFTSVRVDQMHLPFYAEDDDDRHDDGNSSTSVLPADVGSIGLQHTSTLFEALQECCILLEVDGGGATGNNQNNLVFDENTTAESLDLNTRQMGSVARAMSTDIGSYWYVYCGFAYQYRDDGNGLDDSDWDPDNTTGETWTRGINPGAVLYTSGTPRLSMGTDSAWVFAETIADYEAHPEPGLTVDPDTIRRVLAHEIGHQLGLHHEAEMGTPAPHHGLMLSIGDPLSDPPDDDSVSRAENSWFSPFCQNLLRLRYQEVREQ